MANLEDTHRNPVTLTRYLMEERMQHPGASGEFQMLLQSIQLACKVVSSYVAKAGIASMYGLAGDAKTNSTGDVQKKLDVFAQEVFVNCLKFSRQVYAMVSEESDEAIILKDSSGGYYLVFDPLDGSSNIDCNVAVGTIFGIYRKQPEQKLSPEKDLLRPGRELIAAGYAVYGSATMMVLTTGSGVNGFTLDPSIGEFILTHSNIRIPSRGKIYSINEGNAASWDEPTRLFIAKQKQKGKDNKTSSARYVGSMVADIHRTLLYGGIFCYPADAKSPNGKIRLLYECNPISMIVEQAGGKSSTGRMRILDILPKKLHERKPIFCGSKEDVEEVEQLYKKHGNNFETPNKDKKPLASKL